MQRIIVAMSGGIDSTVSALLLTRQGYTVEGVYMSNWDELGQCSTDNDYNDVKEISNKIGIVCRRVEFVKEYWNEIFSNSDYIQDLQRGYTPNPDILCNEKIKFGVFQKYVFDKCGIQMMATGHYGRIRRQDGVFQLLKGIDTFKDQTFFLSTISQESLQHTVFPIGHMTKPQVRQIAIEAGLYKAVNRKESMGLCFIGKRKFSSFINEYIEDRPGLFISHDGHVMGEHKGHHYYTIGQRARMHVPAGPHGLMKPWFVAEKDANKNIVTVVEGTDNPLLYCDTFITGPAHWIRKRMTNDEGMILEARYRHQQKLFTCSVKSINNGLVVMATEDRLRAVAPGQYVVFYEKDECLGGARIEHVCNHSNSNNVHGANNHWSNVLS